MSRLALSFSFILLILATDMCLGEVEIIEDGHKFVEPFIKMHRKVLMEFTLDYVYRGANCKHDPKKGKCGENP